MEKLLENTFSSYDFSSTKEGLAARIFTQANLFWLKNIRSSFAEELVKLTPEGGDKKLFFLRHQELRAQIAIITFLIDYNNEAQEALVDTIKEEKEVYSGEG